MKKNKKITLSLIIIVIFMGIYYLSFVNKKPVENEQQVPQQKQVSDKDTIIKILEEKYNITEFSAWDTKYSLQKQEKLITKEPILFDGYVDDIFKNQGKIYIRFYSWDIYFEYIWELECNKTIVDKVMSNADTSWFAVVANIQNVVKPVFALKGSSISSDEIEIGTEASDLFTISGNCVEIVPLIRLP